MAGRVLSRRALRDEHDVAERNEQGAEQEADGIDESAGASRPAGKVNKPRARKAAAPKPPKEKAPPKPRARKKAVKVPPRMFARWVVYDNGMKRVAVFEYKDRAGADAKLEAMRERKSGTYFLQMIKEAYDPPAVAPDAAVVAV